ncbi:MAG TPA: DUF3027 domain-containing protein [Actinobacteria bacterium]|jgi:hypothetical protein|nr:DUF3027 domain-containing protein [Actinomycetota bacterium]
MTSLVPVADVKRDAALVAAVDVARAAALEEAGEPAVGEHLDVVMEAERLATHLFACTNPAYVGWQWAVTVARVPRLKGVTVSEVVLLPGPDALVAPAWVPWSERVRPGDLSPGDVLPTSADDLRLVPGLTGSDDLESLASSAPLSPGQWEVGLGRLRVLSPIGRDDAADRWVEGDYGPDSAMAKHASLDCSSCGFMLPMSGPMGQLFAVCANEMSPADGHVVALTYGCGAHSEVMPALAEEPAPGGVAPDDLMPGDEVIDAEAIEEGAEDIAVDETPDAASEDEPQV